MSVADVLANRRAWFVAQGHVLDLLRQMPDRSVHVCVTSPPYFGLRSYSTEPQVWGGAPDCEHEWRVGRVRQTGNAPSPKSTLTTNNGRGPLPGDKYQADQVAVATTGDTCARCGAWRGELGQEGRLSDFIAHLVEIFKEVRRVLRDDGTCWVNVGDSYAGSWGNQGRKDERGTQRPINGPMLTPVHDGRYPSKGSNTGKIGDAGLKPKDLMLVPARLAIALQDDGWYVRSHIIWAKKSCMPESVTDRPTSAHESIFLLTKRPRYFYDAQAVAEESSGVGGGGWSQAYAEAQPAHGAMRLERPADNGTRNLRNVWHLGPEPLKEGHYAAFVTEIPRRAILAGSSAKGVCPACGAPWRRVVERGALVLTQHKRPTPTNRGDARRDPAARMDAQPIPHAYYPQETVGWEAGCACNAGDPIPALVLDPFCGSGTTLLTALRHGRRAIGLELSPEYIRLSEKRIVGDSPLFNLQEVQQ